MKKILLSIIIILIVLLSGTVFAIEEKNIIETTKESGIIEQKSEVQSQIDEYVQKYESESYGMAAFILNIVRVYSIPLCFVGIAVGALHQYVLGTRRLDVKHRGFGIIIASITILVICQVLPLVFLIVVKGWRG